MKKGDRERMKREIVFWAGVVATAFTFMTLTLCWLWAMRQLFG